LLLFLPGWGGNRFFEVILFENPLLMAIGAGKNYLLTVATGAVSL